MTFSSKTVYNIFSNGEAMDAQSVLPACDKAVKIPVKVNSAFPEPQPNLSRLVDPPTAAVKRHLTRDSVLMWDGKAR